MKRDKMMRRLAVLPVKSGHRKVLARRLGVDKVTMKPLEEEKVVIEPEPEPKKKKASKKKKSTVKED